MLPNPEIIGLFAQWVRRVGEREASAILLRLMRDYSPAGTLEEIARKEQFENSLR